MNGYAERKRAAEEIGAKGEEIYNRQIRQLVEDEHDGEFLVVDVTTGGYYLAENDEEAFEKAESANPSGRFYLIKVGRRAAHRIGTPIKT